MLAGNLRSALMAARLGEEGEEGQEFVGVGEGRSAEDVAVDAGRELVAVGGGVGFATVGMEVVGIECFLRWVVPGCG